VADDHPRCTVVLLESVDGLTFLSTNPTGFKCRPPKVGDPGYIKSIGTVFCKFLFCELTFLVDRAGGWGVPSFRVLLSQPGVN
jgi:hypothetical protein